jgi:hypothetical protein
VTSLVYLSDVEAGGQTVFSNLDLAVEPQQGRVLVFPIQTAHSPDSNYLRRSILGLVITS